MIIELYYNGIPDWHLPSMCGMTDGPSLQRNKARLCTFASFSKLQGEHVFMQMQGGNQKVHNWMPTANFLFSRSLRCCPASSG